VVLACASSALADTIMVRAGAGASPSEVTLEYQAAVSSSAFVGIVLNTDASAPCPADFAEAAVAPGAVPMSVGEFAVAQSGQIVGSTVTAPTGSYRLCGWAEPEGNKPGSRASAVGGPVYFSVDGPGGTTAVHAPAASDLVNVTIPVSYELNQVGGGFPGLATATLGAWAMPAAGLPCSSGPTATSRMLKSSDVTSLSAANGPVAGSVAFTGHLAAGEYQVCSYLLQTFALGPQGLPNPLNASMFGFGTGKITVLPHIGELRARPRVFSQGGGTSFRYLLDEQATVTLTIRRLFPGRGTRAGRTCLLNPATHRRVCGQLRIVGVVRSRPVGHVVRQRFSGRLHGRDMTPGIYLVTAVAQATDGAESPAASATFAVLR
jgi:hypothetical protein